MPSGRRKGFKECDCNRNIVIYAIRKQSHFPPLVISLLFLFSIGSIPAGAQIQLASKDSTTTMRIRAGLQMRYEYAHPESGKDVAKISLDRARLILQGKAFVPGLTYFLQLAGEPGQRDIAETDPNKTLLDAWVQYDFSSHLRLRLGQFNMPSLRQGYTSIFFQQFSGRSQLSQTFTYNRDIGLLLIGKLNAGGILIKPYYMFVTGEGRSFIDISKNTGNQHIFKLEVLTGGEYATAEGFSESDLDREGHPKGSFSIGYEINNDPLRQRGNAGAFLFDSFGSPLGARIKSLLIDAQIKFRGFSTVFEYIDRDADNALFISGKGYNFQMAYLFISNLEIGGRFSKIDLNGVDDSWKERRVTFNRYFKDHNLKLQGEYGQTTRDNRTDHSIIFVVTVFI